MGYDFGLPDISNISNIAKALEHEEETPRSLEKEGTQAKIRDALFVPRGEKVYIVDASILSEKHSFDKNPKNAKILKKIHSAVQQQGLKPMQFAEHEDEVHFASKDKELERLEKEGVEFVYLFKNDRGEIQKKSLKGKKITHKDLSDQECARIYNACQIALNNLGEHFKKLQEKERQALKRGRELLERTTPRSSINEKRGTAIAKKIFAAETKQGQIRIAEQQKEEDEKSIEKDHIKKEAQEKHEKHVATLAKRQKEMIEEKATINEDIIRHKKNQSQE